MGCFYFKPDIFGSLIYSTVNPGNIGVHQFACVLAFGILGMDKTQAVAFSFYYQIPVIVISVILGFISIYFEGFSVKGISRISNEAKSAGFNEVS